MLSETSSSTGYPKQCLFILFEIVISSYFPIRAKFHFLFPLKGSILFFYLLKRNTTRKGGEVNPQYYETIEYSQKS